MTCSGAFVRCPGAFGETFYGPPGLRDRGREGPLPLAVEVDGVHEHRSALVRLVREADRPDLLLAEIVELLMIRNPVNAEAVVVRASTSGHGAQGVELLGVGEQSDKQVA